MLDKKKQNTESLIIPLPDEAMENVEGGASDYSGSCGMQLSNKCFFCTKRKDSHMVSDGVWTDVIGCSLSAHPLGAVNGYVYGHGNPLMVPPDAK